MAERMKVQHEGPPVRTGTGRELADDYGGRVAKKQNIWSRFFYGSRHSTIPALIEGLARES